MRRRDQRVDRQEPERRRAVNHHRVELVDHRVQPILQPEVRVQLPHQPSLELRERDA